MHSDEKELIARYLGIWNSNIERFLTNNVAVDPLPEAGQPRWGISTVLKPSLPESVWETIEALTLELGGHHAYYEPDGIHITIRSNENYRTIPQNTDLDSTGYAHAFADALDGLGKLQIRYKGIVGSSTSLLLCGYPEFDLAGLRKKYYKILETRGFIRPGPEQGQSKIRNTCHTSLVMFSGSLDDPVAAATKLNAISKMDFGTVAVPTWDIVGYERSHARIRTISTAPADIKRALFDARSTNKNQIK